MQRDMERVRRIQRALEKYKLDAVICTLPTNVLMLSGYWPVVGCSIALATRDGQIALIVPEDEAGLAALGWADDLRTFKGGSLGEIKSRGEHIRAPLAELTTKLRIFNRGAIGYESSEAHLPVGYVAAHLFMPILEELLAGAFYGARLVAAGNLLAQLRALLTDGEITRVRKACEIAENAFIQGAKSLHIGASEIETANFFRASLTRRSGSVSRADGFAYCMSGENGFKAFAAFQHSTSRKIEPGDLVLIHCNSYADGFWTDITRTFCLGALDDVQKRIFEAIFAARDAAIAMVKPGIKASEVDKAARDTLKEYGFEKEFRHPTGHGVGFAAIDHNALPRIHPKSNDLLEPGMVFNVEPGIYIEGFGGARHCDMVAVTEDGSEMLTPFQSTVDDLVLPVEDEALIEI